MIDERRPPKENETHETYTNTIDDIRESSVLLFAPIRVGTICVTATFLFTHSFGVFRFNTHNSLFDIWIHYGGRSNCFCDTTVFKKAAMMTS